MVLSVHVHLSTVRRHPPTVALPASSSGTREPRFGDFDAPPSLPRSPTKTLSHATHKMDLGILSTCTHVQVPWGSELCYYLLPILGAKLGSLPPSRFTRFHCCFQSRCGWPTRTVPTARTQERGAVVDFLGVWESGTLTLSRRLYWGESPVRSWAVLNTPRRHIASVFRRPA